MIISTKYKKAEWDTFARDVEEDIKDLHLNIEVSLVTESLYKINGNLTNTEANNIASKFLTDNVNQTYEINQDETYKIDNGSFVVDIWFKHGVTDVVSETVENGIKDLGINKNLQINTGKRYIFSGKNLTKEKVTEITEQLLANSVIQEYKLQ